jgi:hypothetical protein
MSSRAPRTKRTGALRRRARRTRVARNSQSMELRFPGFNIAGSMDAPIPMSRDTTFTTIHTVRFPAWITSSTLVPVAVAQAFSLDQLDDFKAYTTIFDEYKIEGVEAMISPLVDVAPIVGQSTGMLASVVDTDDAVPLTTFAESGHYTNCITTTGNYSHLRSIRPKFSRALYSSALVTGYGSSVGWLDSSSPSVPHYGLKAIWSTTSAPIQADLVVRYLIAFRHAI